MRRLIFSICIGLCCLVLAGNICLSEQTAQANRSETSAPGNYVYTEGASPYAVDCYLCGEWEYYPGILIYQEEEEPGFQGGIGAVDPSAGLDELFQITEENVRHTADVNTREESDYQPEELRWIQVPSAVPRSFFDHAPDQVSSYRMVIQNLPPTQDFDMILSLQGLVYGDYELYIDGHHTLAMLPPYGYPTYYFPVAESGTVELVIQTSHTSSLLNITPRISFKGTAMESFDSYRNAILILSAMIVTALVIMMVLMFSLDRKYLYLPFLTGFLFTLNYLLNHLWATGYQGVLTQVIPQAFLPHLAWLMLAGGLAMTCLAPETVHASTASRRLLRAMLVLLAIAFAARGLDLLAFHTYAGLMLSDLLTAAVVIIQLILTYRWMPQLTRATWLLQTGLFLMVTGSISSGIHQMYGFWNLFLYVQPVTILIYTGFVFYNNKSNQIHLLARTRELLEVERLQ